VAFSLAGYSILSAIIFHGNYADQNNMTMFKKNIAIAGSFLFLFAHGPRVLMPWTTAFSLALGFNYET
jgi:putative oxidoreductase